MDERPYLSVVVAARNDDHGGNLLQRMQLFVTGLLEQARRFDLYGELIAVEWNPPRDQPSLVQALTWCPVSERFAVRIIKVPVEIHRRFTHSAGLPFFQMIAKNAGIRRARGRFVLATNVDLLFSNALTRHLASGILEHGWIYRTNRYDVPAGIPNGMSIEDQLHYCRSHVVRLYLRYGSFAYKYFRTPDPFLLWLGSSQSIVAKISRRLLRRLRMYGPSRIQAGVLWNRERPERTTHEQSSPRIQPKEHSVSALAATLRAILTRTKHPNLHLNACGDFTLMAREDWFRLRGYPELEMFSLHLDSLLCVMAYYGGIREKLLNDPMCVYHIEHHDSWTDDDQSNSDLMRQLNVRRVPVLTLKMLNDYMLQMEQQRHSILFNSEDWGLASESLLETTVNSVRLGPG